MLTPRLKTGTLFTALGGMFGRLLTEAATRERMFSDGIVFLQKGEKIKLFGLWM